MSRSSPAGGGRSSSPSSRTRRPQKGMRRTASTWFCRSSLTLICPISCPSPTTFWTTFPSTRTGAEVEPSTETLIPPIVPLQVPLPVPHKHLKSKEQPDEHHQQCGRGNKHFVAGRDWGLDGGGRRGPE